MHFDIEAEKSIDIKPSSSNFKIYFIDESRTVKGLDGVNPPVFIGTQVSVN